MGVTPMVLMSRHPAARPKAHLMASVLTCSPERRSENHRTEAELAAREHLFVVADICLEEFVAKKLVAGFSCLPDFLDWRFFFGEGLLSLFTPHPQKSISIL